MEVRQAATTILKEIAFDYAFLLTQLEATEV